MSFAYPAGPDAPFSAEDDPELAMTPNGQPGTLRPVAVDASGDEIHEALATQQTMIATFCQLSSPNWVTEHSSVSSWSVVHWFARLQRSARLGLAPSFSSIVSLLFQGIAFIVIDVSLGVESFLVIMLFY
jgi:hypothetical protein